MKLNKVMNRDQFQIGVIIVLICLIIAMIYKITERPVKYIHTLKKPMFIFSDNFEYYHLLPIGVTLYKDPNKEKGVYVYYNHQVDSPEGSKVKPLKSLKLVSIKSEQIPLILKKLNMAKSDIKAIIQYDQTIDDKKRAELYKLYDIEVSIK